MSREAIKAMGTGTAWLVANRIDGGFFCYWYVGKTGDHLRERARAATAAAAVRWGRDRTQRVRIRMLDARTYWAGGGPLPNGYAGRWSDEVPAGQ
jgi:hypothetical protein